MANKKYFFANWKMYLDYSESVALAEHMKNTTLPKDVGFAVFPSSLAFKGVNEVLSSSEVSTGAQNISFVEKGGYTGEVSALMYKQTGGVYALIGHSERRHLFGESNHDVRKKMESAVSAELIPVLCVGETEAQRAEDETKKVLETQLESALESLDFLNVKELFVAYEPVWAISKGRALEVQGKFCDPAEAEKNATYITNLASEIIPKNIKLSVLFGGSVRPSTIEGYVSRINIDGVLVGAASTTIDSFLELASVFQ
jgi:triosephosphate isomerase